MTSYVMEYPFGQLSQLCPLPASCAVPAYCWWGRVRSRKGLDSV